MSTSGLVQSIYNTIYDSVYLTFSKKMTGSQLNLPHGINKKLKYQTKNKLVSMTSPIVTKAVQWVEGVVKIVMI